MKYFLIYLLINFSFTAFGQSLTINQLIELRNKDLGEVEEYLISKGWKLNQIIDPSSFDVSIGFISFTYSKNNIQASLQYFIHENQLDNTVSLSVYDSKIYSNYQMSLKKAGYKYRNSFVKNYPHEISILTKVYENTKYVIELSSSPANMKLNLDASWTIYVSLRENYFRRNKN